MKYFVVFCLIVACAAAAPEPARNKRAYLFNGYVPQVYSYNRLLHVNRVVDVPHVVNVRQVVTVPEVLPVNHVVHHPTYTYI